jgi:hypothetical protein
MVSIHKFEMNGRYYCPGHSTTVTFMSGQIFIQANRMLAFEPIHWDKIKNNRDKKNPGDHYIS